MRGWYVAHPLSYRQLAELVQARGAAVDQATINRQLLKYTPQIEEALHRRKRPVWISWPVNKTYIRLKGQGVNSVLPGIHQLDK